MKYPIDPIAQEALNFIKTTIDTGNLGEGPLMVAQESLGIPLLAEAERIQVLCTSLERALGAAKKKQFLIFFVNQREEDDEAMSISNIKCLEFLGADKNKKFSLGILKENPIMVLNGSLAEFYLKNDEGVGRARKVMADLALGMWKRGLLESEIHRQTDGDAKVPLDYFQSELLRDSVAATYPFTHTQGELSDEEFSQLKIYEKWLHSYSQGLKFAGSRYAFWPLGSTLMFCLSAYEKVRGVPNVRAGEDFHFLSKMSKLGPVYKLGASPIELRGRHSTRVPFGTGRALLNMKSGQRAYEEFPLEIFQELKVIVKKINELAENKDLEKFLRELSVNDHAYFLDFQKPFGKILAQSSSVLQKQKQLHEAFDALKTMRWVNMRMGIIHRSRF